MNSTRLSIGIVCAALFLTGCGREIIIVKAHPKTGSGWTNSGSGQWNTNYNSGLAHYNKKEYIEALHQYELALKHAGDDDEARAWIYFSMGRCWEGLKDLAKAEQNYITAQYLDPNLTEASDGLARIGKLRAQKE